MVSVALPFVPVLLSNAWRAAESLAAIGVSAAVINLPWLNRIDEEWVRTTLGRYPLNSYRLLTGYGDLAQRPPVPARGEIPNPLHRVAPLPPPDVG